MDDPGTCDQREPWLTEVLCWSLKPWFGVRVDSDWTLLSWQDRDVAGWQLGCATCYGPTRLWGFHTNLGKVASQRGLGVGSGYSGEEWGVADLSYQKQ